MEEASPTTCRDLDASKTIMPFKDFRRVELDRIERHYLGMIYEKTRHNVMEACLLSGLSKTRFYNLLKKHGLSRRRG
jgi:two-component system NtrC family response regulator